MDGVLIDSRTVIENAWREAALMYKRHLTDEDIQKHIHGHPGPYTIRTLFGDLPVSDQQRVQSHIIHVENTTDCELIPGVARLIESLGKAGIYVGIVTSGWRQKINRVIELLHAEPYISVIVERDDVTRGKPHPEPYILATQRLGIPASQAVVFEDAKSGVISAVTAGSYCIGVGDEDLMPLGAKTIIPDFQNVKLSRNSTDSFMLKLCPEHFILLNKINYSDRQLTQQE
ncbi:HAD-IA family hydrolase [Salmonella enterica subsp. enterica serovar Enteritidis]|nr:HAD family phosphatase [Salmonella enterica]ECA1939745.1 HAD family phosphatase [Salmonella enterica subsp. enterica serovar Enteritidis]ECC9068312.1 HAD family phosphatase [Salmonella enterica subsp. diarizonae]ECY5113369.1 HAD family phosphatase [Salmonella enterica subsp. enterica serovar Typhimurium]EEM3072807.1 HAD-IA family hydrolase [Salmonella enterica subsp. enterica serovar Java]EKB3332794.1 HAD family phosphatase [Salmonella enterica subsp. enterica serovar Chandans]